MVTASDALSESISFHLDGRLLSAHPGETILQAARRHGVEIPQLCYRDGLRADGNCRACVVEIKGEQLLAPACCRVLTEGMIIDSLSARARASQRLVLELLQSEVTPSPTAAFSELEHWCTRLGVNKSRFTTRHQPPADLSHPAIAVHLDACIQCTRCVRFTDEISGTGELCVVERGDRSVVDVFPGIPIDNPLAGNTIAGSNTATFTWAGSNATPIATIQANPQSFDGQTVTVEGQVYIPTNYRGDTTFSGYIQDGSGRGINIFGTQANVAALQDPGNIVRVTGEVDIFFTTVEILNLIEVTLLSSGNPPLTPLALGAPPLL